MKRSFLYIAVSCIIAAFSAASVFGMSLEDYLEQAELSSEQVQRYEMNRQSSLLTLSKADAEDGIQWTWDFGTTKYATTISSPASPSPDFSADPGFSVSFPETEGGLKWTLGLKTALGSNGASTNGTISPMAQVMKSFDLGYVYDVDELKKASKLLQIETTYQTNMLSFQVSFLNTLKGIITQQLAVEKAQRSLDKSIAALDKALLLKTVSEGTPNYIDLNNVIEGQRIALQNAADKLDMQIAGFERKYGVAYAEPEISEIELAPVESDPDGNSAVKLKWQALQLAQEALKNKTETTRTLSASASLRGTLGIGSSAASKAGAGAGADFTSSDGWTASAGVDLEWNFAESSLTPTLKLSGKYTPSNRTDAEAIEQKELEYNVLEAKMDWEDALSSYLEDIVDMQSSIRALQAQISADKSGLEYYQKLVETAQAKLELGLSSQSDVDDALFSEKEARCLLIGDYIDAMVLQKQAMLLGI